MTIKLTTVVRVNVCTSHGISWLHVFGHSLNFFYVMMRV